VASWSYCANDHEPGGLGQQNVSLTVLEARRLTSRLLPSEALLRIVRVSLLAPAGCWQPSVCLGL
jgi:hypothetical protein